MESTDENRASTVGKAAGWSENPAGSEVKRASVRIQVESRTKIGREQSEKRRVGARMRRIQKQNGPVSGSKWRAQPKSGEHSGKSGGLGRECGGIRKKSGQCHEFSGEHNQNRARTVGKAAGWSENPAESE